MYEISRITKIYGEGVLGVSREVFRKWALELKHNFFNKNGKEHTGWIFPALFCTMRYIYNPRCRYQDSSTSSYRSATARKAGNVRFI